MSDLSDKSRIFIDGATIDDLDAIHAIEEASFTAPWSRKALEVELTNNPFARVYVARDDRAMTPVGYVCFWLVFEELRMMNLAVLPSERRRRIGSALLWHALTIGRTEGARRALLEVRASNGPALALYERAGFRRTGLRNKYYANPVEDAVLMELDRIDCVRRPEGESSDESNVECQPSRQATGSPPFFQPGGYR